MKLKLPKKGGGGAPSEAKATKVDSGTKKQIITTAITVVLCIVVAAIANTARGVFAGMETESYNAAAKLQSDIDNFQKSDPAFAEDVQVRGETDKAKVKWVTPGEHEDLTSVDAGRWMSDEAIFWDFISPAFSFNSATEYNQMREEYIQKLGNCLFTVQFMGYYDIESKCRKNENGTVNQADFERYDAAYTCTTDKSKYYTYPVAKDNNGNYTYVAMVPMKSVYVMFTYTIEHSPGQGGNERITLTNFDCWPPNSQAKLGT